MHCHLAIGVDDGPQTPEESRALAMGLKNAGVTHVACTSHLRRDKNWLNQRSKQNSIHRELDHCLALEGPIRVPGAEHYLDESLLGACLHAQVVPYGNSNWILVELPYQIEPPFLFQTLFRIRMAGYRLILAHIERYPYIHRHAEKLAYLLNSGYLLQVNLGSFSGAYGKDYQLTAHKLLQNQQVSLVASDCHRADDVEPFLVEGLKALRKKASRSQFEQLTLEQPSQILENL